MAELTDHAHAELLLLYQNATDNIAFCKKQQWWNTVQIITVYFALLFVDRELDGASDRLIDITLIIVAFLLAGLMHYFIRSTHRSGNAERDRVDYLEGQFSRMFSYARRRKEVSPAPLSREIAEDILLTQLWITWLGWAFFVFICWNYPTTCP